MGNVNKRFLLVFVVIIAFILSNSLSAQHIIEASNADPTDMRAMFINPALSSSLNPHVLLGIKFFNLGFLNSNSLGLRNNYLSFSVSKLPYNTGLGVSIYHLGTPIFTKTSFGFNISKGLFNKIFLGSKFEILSSGFNENQFDLIYQNDPVFENGVSKTVLSIGGGLLFRPFKRFTVGYSVNHLNTPNISLENTNVVEPRIIDFGMSHMFPYFRISGGMTWVRSDYYPNFSMILNYWDFGSFCLGYGYSGLQLGSRFSILNRVELNYVFNYPLSEINAESFGSHQINLVFHLKKPEEHVNIFDIFIETDSLFVFQKWFYQQVGKNIPPQIAAKSFDKLVPKYTTISIPENMISSFESKYYSKLYLSFMDSLSRFIQQKKPAKVRIICGDKELNRAVGIKKYLSDKINKHRDNIIILTKPAQEDTSYISNFILVKDEVVSGKKCQTFLSSRKTTFHVTSTYRMRTNYWILEIVNNAGKVVLRFEGRGRVNSKIDWNWCDHGGRLVDPGWYYVTFRWKDKRERFHKSSKKVIRVTKRSQHIDVHVLKDIRGFEANPEVIDIIIE